MENQNQPLPAPGKPENRLAVILAAAAAATADGPAGSRRLMDAVAKSGADRERAD